jgi:F-type H+-transporting ATPase subunit a
MGEHGTWFDYLYRFEWYRNLMHSAEGIFGREMRVLMFQDSHFTLTHVFTTAIVVLLLTYAALRFRSGVTAKGQSAIVPPARMDVRHFFELFCDSVYGLVTESLGEENGKKFFPFIGALALFIFFNNLIGLVPGFAPPTDTIKTNVSLALLVFFATHIYGVKEHGLGGYLKHFMGPSPVLAPLIFLIEVISHLARPVSLTLRLMGNMMADHKVVFAFTTLVPILIPLPFYVLGILVCFVQTLVFCLLALVYIGSAMEHEH